MQVKSQNSRTYDVDENNFSNCLFSRRKTILANIFSFYRVWQTSNNKILGSTSYYGNHCASFKIISVTPKRLLKTQIFEKEKTFLPPKNYFGQKLSRTVEYKKAQGTLFSGPQGIMAGIAQYIRSILQDLRGR